MATQFNLRPWRQYKREKHITRVRISLDLCFFLGCVLGLLHYSYAKMQRTDHQRAYDFISQRNQLLTESYQQMVASAERNSPDYLSNTLFVKGLIAFAPLPREELDIRSLSFDSGDFIVRGYAKNSLIVTRLMQTMQNVELFSEPQLRSLNSQMKDTHRNTYRGNEFVIASSLIHKPPPGK